MKFKNKKTGAIVNTTTDAITELYKTNKEYEEVKAEVEVKTKAKKEEK